MPIVDRVVCTLTANPNYAGFWNYTASIWADKFHVRPTLMFYGSGVDFEAFMATNPLYEVRHVERVPEVTLDLNLEWACTWSLFWGAAQFPDDVCLLAGIDQVPLNGAIFDQIKKTPRSGYTVGFSDAYCEPTSATATYPSSHHAALGSTFREMFRIADKWPAEVRKVYDTRSLYSLPSNAWGLDEAYSSHILRMANTLASPVHFVRGFRGYMATRLYRGKDLLSQFDFEGIRQGRFSEWHANRPLSANDPALLAKLKDAIPDYQWT